MITSLIAPSPAISTKSTQTTNRGRRGWAVAAVGAMILGTLIGGTGISSAAPVTSNGTATATATVASAMTLTMNLNAFDLPGAPGETVPALGAVTMHVITNNLLGYKVTVQAASATMTPTTVSTPANGDSIPVGALSVREAIATPPAYAPLSNSTPVSVHNQVSRSVATPGDLITNDYQLVTPFVNQDVYTVTLNYIATTL